MQVSTEFSCNSVVWISSLVEKEMSPTRRMIGSMRDHAQQLNFDFQWFNVRTKSELYGLLDRCNEFAASNRLRPIIHLDTHGNKEKGLWIEHEESFVAWDHLGEKLRSINESTKNNLCVVGATCFGLHAITSISIDKAAPFFVLLAPEEKVNVGFLEKNIPVFYQAIFAAGSVDDAYDRFLEEKFGYFHCEKLLFVAIARYIEQYCKGKTRDERREFLLTQIMSEGVDNSSENRKFIRDQIRTGIKPDQDLVDKYSSRFLVGRKCNFNIDDLTKHVDESYV